jgi:SAM-dependent methyltransferase
MTITNKYFGQTAIEYDAKRRHSRTWAAENGAFQDLFHLASRSAPIESAVDIPCGTGRWIPFFQDRNIRYTGVDVSKDMLAIASRQIRDGDAGEVRLVEHDCFQYLPAHRGEFDLAVSTRFLNWWHTDRAVSIIESLCGVSRSFVIIHIRVHDHDLQVGLRRVVKLPKFIARYVAEVVRSLKQGRVVLKHNVLDIESHPRRLVEDRIKALGWKVQEKMVVKRLVYASVEFWLLRKDETERPPQG